MLVEQFTNVFCWSHADFNSPLKDFYVADGGGAHHGSVKLGQRLDHPGDVLVPGPVSGQVLQHQQELQEEPQLVQPPMPLQ